MEQLVNCLSSISAELDRRGVQPGNLTHAVAQLELAFRNQGAEIERHIQQFVASGVGDRGIQVDRFVDVVYERLINGIRTVINNEIKTGRGDASSVLDPVQLRRDAAIAIQNAIDTHGQQALANVWRLMSDRINVTERETQEAIRTFLNQTKAELRSQGFTTDQIRAAIGSFNFVDAAGNAVRAVLAANGRIIFEPAMEELFGPDGNAAQTATRKAGNSPNFGPAMDIIFGPSGKVADAAHDAVQGTNLQPALQNLEGKVEEGVRGAMGQTSLTPAMETLEEKVEQGVRGAMNQAGDAARAAAAQSLGSRVGAGATALGNVMTSIPQLHQSVTQLGEAWRRPMRSTADYMALLGAAGGVVTQSVQVFQALAGVTQIASAAQAVFNAVMAMNPIVLIILAVIALIAVIVLLVVYWDEVKLAVLRAANFISIQVQRIGQFFAGLGRLIGMVWDYIVASVENVGISIINTFISIGTQVQNFFIGLINSILEMYNSLATSAIGEFLGLETAELIPEVDVETRLIPPREVPEIDVQAAFRTDQITGGLEGAIAEQEAVVRRGREEEARRSQQAQGQQQPAPGTPPAPHAPPPAPAPAPGARPEIPAGAAAAAPAAAGGGPVDASVTVNGGITVNINAERLEADAAQLLSDQMISAIQARLGALRSEQDFRTGVRAPAPA